jgi:UDPglucose 6-dehydrogenase
LQEVADYWEQVIIMNDHQKKRFANQMIRELYNTVNGKKISFLGWAFKKDTNDTRESAAIYVADHLLHEQAYISVYDPKVSEDQVYADLDYLASRTQEENRNGVKVVTDPYEACKGAHAIAVLTEWDEFKDYDWQKIYDSMLKPAKVFDGRNLLDTNKLTDIGFIVQAIGKK